MSMDASLKAASALIRHRNVLTRGERLEKLKEDEKWRTGQVLGLPKVAHRKAAIVKAVKEETAEGAEGAAAPAAAGAKPAAGAKAAAPAAAAKGAPAAKGAAPAAKAAAPAAKGKK
jgi:small basic protein (TIGR04137 family)